MVGEDVLVCGDTTPGREAESAGVTSQVGGRDAEIGGDVGERAVVVLVLLAKPGGAGCAQNLTGNGWADSAVDQERADALMAAASRPDGQDVAPAVDEPVGPEECQFSEGFDYVENPSRTMSCSDTVWELFTTKTEGGLTKNTGWMNFENLQWSVYSPNSTSWLHGAYIAVKAGGWGTLEDGVQGRIDPLCRVSQTSQCTAVQPSNPDDGKLVTLTSGTVYEVTWGENDASDASTQPDKALIRSDVGLRISGPGSGADIPAWSFDDDYLVGRCDARTTSSGNVSRGCVNHVFTPTLNLSVSTRGSSATMVAWAQTNLNWHPGKEGQGEPLHYKREYDTDRKIMCGAFVPDSTMNEALIPYNTKDSCDEYAFDASYENPANTGAIKDGAECAQLTAVQNDNTGVLAADWRDVALLGSSTGSEKCVRGHIPLFLNSAAGGDYGRLVTSARLIDNDAYWVAVNP